MALLIIILGTTCHLYAARGGGGMEGRGGMGGGQRYGGMEGGQRYGGYGARPAGAYGYRGPVANQAEVNRAVNRDAGAYGGYGGGNVYVGGGGGYAWDDNYPVDPFYDEQQGQNMYEQYRSQN